MAAPVVTSHLQSDSFGTSRKLYSATFTDTQLSTATVTASTGTWEELSGTTPTPTDDGVFVVYVDCDGTAGWVNVDDWS